MVDSVDTTQEANRRRTADSEAKLLQDTPLPPGFECPKESAYSRNIPIESPCSEQPCRYCSAIRKRDERALAQENCSENQLLMVAFALRQGGPRFPRKLAFQQRYSDHKEAQTIAQSNTQDRSSGHSMKSAVSIRQCMEKTESWV